jgi:hypothetical protein
MLPNQEPRREHQRDPIDETKACELPLDRERTYRERVQSPRSVEAALASKTRWDREEALLAIKFLVLTCIDEVKASDPGEHPTSEPEDWSEVRLKAASDSQPRSERSTS